MSKVIVHRNAAKYLQRLPQDTKERIVVAENAGKRYHVALKEGETKAVPGKLV
jgi:hypothetical protein